MRAPTQVSFVCVVERFGYMSTNTPVLFTPDDGEIHLFEHSYSCACCLCDGEV